MKASDKFKSEIRLREEQIVKIKSDIDERNTLLSFKDQKGFFGFSQLTGKERFSISRKYYLYGKEIPKSEFDKCRDEFNKLHETDYETRKKLTGEIKTLNGALERALVEEANKITAKGKNKNSRSYEFELHYIIKIVSNWKNIEMDGNYSQSKLAAKMGKGRWYITRLFKQKFTYYENERTFKQHLIALVKNAIEKAKDPNYYNKIEVIVRLEYFLKCLTRDAESISFTIPHRGSNAKIKDKIKRQY